MSRLALLGRVLVVLLLIGSVYFALSYLKERQQQEALATRLNDATRTLALLPHPPADLPQRLAEAQQANAAAKTIWPVKIDTTQIIKSILTLSDTAGVKAMPLSTDQWTTKTVSDNKYRVLTIKISFEGTVANLITFLNRLYDSEFTTLSVETLTVAKAAGSAPDLLSGTIELAVYTLPSN